MNLESQYIRFALSINSQHRLVCGLLFALTLVFSCSGCQSFSQLLARRGTAAEANRLMQGGINALQDGRTSQAESLLNRAATTRPEDPRIRENLARALAQQGKLDLAIENMSQAVTNSHGDPLLNVQLGKLYLQAGQLPQAAGQASLALELNRKLPEAWTLKAESELAQGNLSSALSHFQRALGYQPNMPDVQIKVASIQRQLGRPMRALSTLEHMLRQYPTEQQPEPAVILASSVLMDVQQTGHAIEMLTAATERQNSTSAAFVQLSKAQLAAGQLSQARLTLVQASSAFPDQPEIQQQLAGLQSSDERVAAAGLDNENVIR